MIVVYKAEIPRREVESGTELARQWRDANLIRAVDTTPAELGQSWRHIIENPGSNPELQDISNPGAFSEANTSCAASSNRRQTSGSSSSSASRRAAHQTPSAREVPVKWSTEWQGSARTTSIAATRSALTAADSLQFTSAMSTRPPVKLQQGLTPDYTAMVEDPDTRRHRQLVVQHGKHKADMARRKWRAECLTIARQRRLSDVENMRLVWVSPMATHRSGASVVMVVGAHYRAELAPLEDIMLHVVKEFEKLRGRPWVLLYFNADAPMKALPNTVWFQEMHAALPEQHQDTLQALYLVHPQSHRIMTRAWMFVLQGQHGAFYGKVQLVNNLSKLLVTEFNPGTRHDIPQLVLDYCARHPGAT